MKETTMRKGYNGYLLTPQGRADLLTHIEPVFPDVIAHHVTHEYGVYESLLPQATYVRVLAMAMSDTVQAVIVRVGDTHQRDDGSYYHITVSIDRSAGANPVDSNVVIADPGNWISIDPFTIEVDPQFFPF